MVFIIPYSYLNGLGSARWFSSHDNGTVRCWLGLHLKTWLGWMSETHTHIWHLMLAVGWRLSWVKSFGLPLCLSPPLTAWRLGSEVGDGHHSSGSGPQLQTLPNSILSRRALGGKAGSCAYPPPQGASCLPCLASSNNVLRSALRTLFEPAISSTWNLSLLPYGLSPHSYYFLGNSSFFRFQPKLFSFREQTNPYVELSDSNYFFLTLCCEIIIDSQEVENTVECCGFFIQLPQMMACRHCRIESNPGHWHWYNTVIRPLQFLKNKFFSFTKLWT